MVLVSQGRTYSHMATWGSHVYCGTCRLLCRARWTCIRPRLRCKHRKLVWKWRALFRGKFCRDLASGSNEECRFKLFLKQCALQSCTTRERWPRGDAKFQRTKLGQLGSRRDKGFSEQFEIILCKAMLGAVSGVQSCWRLVGSAVLQFVDGPKLE